MLSYETEALATEAEAETKAFSVETKAKTKTFTLEAEARPRLLKSQLRRDRAEVLLCLEMASVSRRQDRGHIPGNIQIVLQHCHTCLQMLIKPQTVLITNYF